MPFVLAASAPPFLVEVAILLTCGAVIAYAGYRVGLVPIVGFLLTGVVIGPNALGLVQDQALIDAAAEVGVILLLFTIGIEFSLEKLARIQRLIFGGGGLQVLLASGATTGVLVLAGVPAAGALFTGFLVALSSTAIVLKLLGDRGETAEAPGQVSLGLLIFQDLAIIVMVLLVPMLAGAGGSALDIAAALGKAAVVIAVVLVGARRVMPPILERVARTCSQELFLLALIAVCFGTAYLTSLAGVSVALGAFLAGLVVSESRFSEHAFGEIMPLQILFSATFFVSVGMLLDLGFLVDNLLLVLGAVAAVLVIKAVTTMVAVRALGYGLPVAAASALYLAQVGEFSFVLERAGRELNLTPGDFGEAGSQTFIAATVVLMVLTPPLSAFGMRLRRRLEARADERADAASAPSPAAPTTAGEDVERLSDHVVVAGYGRTARRLVRTLRAARVPHVVITLSPPHADDAEATGLPVVRGDVARPGALRLAGVERARLLVVPEGDAEAAARIVSVARTVRPGLPVLARARYEAGADELAEAGASEVVTEEYETVLGLLGAVLRAYGAPDGEVEHRAHALRAERYRALRAEGAAAAPAGDGAAPSEPSPGGVAPAAAVHVYGAAWCPLTGGFRAYLKREGVPYTYHDVEEDPAAEDAVRAMNGGKLKFPMVVVGDREMKNPPIDDLRAALAAAGVQQGSP